MPGRFLCLRPAALTTLGRILKVLQLAVVMPIEDLFDASPRIRTADVDEATDVSSRVYLPVKLRPVGSISLDMDLKAKTSDVDSGLPSFWHGCLSPRR
jgi:hypothetical protein